MFLSIISFIPPTVANNCVKKIFQILIFFLYWYFLDVLSIIYVHMHGISGITCILRILVILKMN